MRRKIQYGLALGGGGTRGAYQAGVAKALKEMNIDIVAVSGTSVGAINGALIVQNDVDKMAELYRNITFKDIFKNDIELDTTKDIFDVKNIFKIISEYIKNNGLDNTALRETLEKYLNVEKIYKSKCDFGTTAFSVTDKEGASCFKKDIPKDEFIDRILASACFPIFKAQKINDEEFFDGGMADVLPINMLIEKGLKNIIAVDIEGPGITKNTISKDVNVKLIFSKEDLGGLFEFNKETIEHNIEMGYLDTLKSFNKLQGHMYFFESGEFYKMLKKFNVQTIYGLECAADLYEVEKYKIYKFEEFIDIIIKRHDAASRKYNGVKDNFDIAGILEKGKDLDDIINTNLGICIVMDILSTRPILRNNKLMKKNLYEYFQATDAIKELMYKVWF